MKKIILIFLLILINGQIFPQDKKGIIKGSIYDKESKQPLESAALQVYKDTGDVLVNGALSDKNGFFEINGFSAGIYKLKISYIGYKTIIITNIIIEKGKKEFDAGIIQLELNNNETKEIVVTAEALIVENTLDKKVYNAEKNPMNETGSALELLQSIPSITVDADGKLSLRGSSNVQILVDGKVPTGKDISDILDQLPANKIDKIEVINNPTAKYDAEGTSGIINIITKKGEAIGYSGNMNLNAGTLDKYNATVGLSYSTKKISLFGGYSGKFMTMEATGSNNLDYLSTSSPFGSVTQGSNRRNQNRTHIGNIGMDYFIDKANIFSLTSIYNYRWRKRVDNILINSFDQENILVNASNEYYTDEDKSNNFEISSGYKHKFDKPMEELTTGFTYSGSWNEDVLNLRNLSGSDLINQNNYRNDNFNTITGQMDYVHPFNENSHYETGLKYNNRKINSGFWNETADINGNWKRDGLNDNSFLYKENIVSAYGMYINKIKNFKIQAGLRAEQSLIISEQAIGSVEYENNYLAFFPSASISQKLSATNELQLSYVRRINRPSYRSLNPFIEYFDLQNISKGNPYLKPEYVNSIELGYIKYFASSSFSTSVFYRDTKNVINRVTTATDSGFTYTTYENLSNSKSYGAELIYAGDITKWWNINANGSYFRTVLDIGNINGISDNSNYTWNGKINSNIKIPKILEIQMSYNYQGKTITAQGYNDPISSFDIVLKRNIIDKRASISFKIVDLFNALKYTYHIEGNSFTQISDRKRVTRTAFLTFTYKFGKGDSTLDKKKKKEDNGNKDEDE